MVGASEIIANITSVNVFEMTRFMVKKNVGMKKQHLNTAVVPVVRRCSTK